MILSNKTRNLLKTSHSFKAFPLRTIKEISLEKFKDKRFLFLTLFLLIFGTIFLFCNSILIPILQSLDEPNLLMIILINLVIVLMELFLPILMFGFSPWSLYLFLKGDKVIRLQLRETVIIIMGKPKLFRMRMENILFFKSSGTTIRLESKLKSMEEFYSCLKDSI